MSTRPEITLAELASMMGLTLDEARHHAGCDGVDLQGESLTLTEARRWLREDCGYVALSRVSPARRRTLGAEPGITLGGVTLVPGSVLTAPRPVRGARARPASPTRATSNITSCSARRNPNPPAAIPPHAVTWPRMHEVASNLGVTLGALTNWLRHRPELAAQVVRVSHAHVRVPPEAVARYAAYQERRRAPGAGAVRLRELAARRRVRTQPSPPRAPTPPEVRRQILLGRGFVPLEDAAAEHGELVPALRRWLAAGGAGRLVPPQLVADCRMLRDSVATLRPGERAPVPPPP